MNTPARVLGREWDAFDMDYTYMCKGILGQHSSRMEPQSYCAAAIVLDEHKAAPRDIEIAGKGSDDLFMAKSQPTWTLLKLGKQKVECSPPAPSRLSRAVAMLLAPNPSMHLVLAEFLLTFPLFTSSGCVRGKHP